jgi:hypothetical protein
MIEPFNRHFFGLKVPLLVLVLREARKASFRSFRELRSDVEHANPVTADEAKRLVAAHAAPWPSVLYPRRAIPGGLLSKRLKDRVYEELGGVCLDLDGMLGKGEWTDRANWVFPLDRAGIPLAPFNRYVASRETKARTPRLLALADRNCSLQVYVPFASCDLDGCSFSIALHPDHGLIGNLDPGTEVAYEEVLAGAQQAFPGIALSTDTLDLAPDAYAIVTARLVTSAGKPIRDADAELYLEHTGGYLPKLRVTTMDGEARFRVGALGLEPGDSFRVKAGFRHYSGVAELAFRVVG